MLTNARSEEGLGGFSGFGAKMRGSFTSASNQMSLVKSVFGAYSAQKKIDAISTREEERARRRAERLKAKQESDSNEASAERSPESVPEEGASADTVGAEGTAEGADGEPDTDSDDEGMSAAELRAVQEEALPAVLEAIWATNVVDISSTVRKVCRQVLRGGIGEERVVPAAVRKVRARDLIRLGQLFQEFKPAPAAKATTSKNKEEAKQDKATAAKEQMESAMMEAMKRQ